MSYLRVSRPQTQHHQKRKKKRLLISWWGAIYLQELNCANRWGFTKLQYVSSFINWAKRRHNLSIQIWIARKTPNRQIAVPRNKQKDLGIAGIQKIPNGFHEEYDSDDTCNSMPHYDFVVDNDPAYACWWNGYIEHLYSSNTTNSQQDAGIYTM